MSISTGLCAAILIGWSLMASVEALREPQVTTPPRVGSLPLDPVTQLWTGDFDGMVQRRRVRLLTSYSKTHYFVDKGVQRGIVYDFGRKLEDEINRTLKTGPATKVHVVFVPTARDQLFQALADGRGDIIASNLAITPASADLVAFTVPGQTNVSSILVTGPASPTIGSL